MTRTIAALGACLAAGCAQNAWFELQVELPASPPGETWFAQVQIMARERDPFEVVWDGSAAPTVPLGATPRWDCISVESQDAAQSVAVRVRFCRSEDCIDLADASPPERLYTFETPFHIGSRTYYRVSVPAIPRCTTDADCAVGVCMAERCACAAASDCGDGHECVIGVGCVQAVDRCSIEGCIEGPVSATFCSLETGEHFCERNPDITRDATYACRE